MMNPNNSLFSKIRRLLTGGTPVIEMQTAAESADPQDRDYEAIAPTAAQVARFRAFSDIPFAAEMEAEIHAGAHSGELELGNDAFVRKAAVVFEARYKGINAVLEQYPKIKNYIEIPAGFSTRGMEMIRKNGEISYLECDVAPVIRAKRNLVARLWKKAGIDPCKGLVFEQADILREPDLRRIEKLLPRGPVAVVTEGLLNYFSREDKVKVARNIHRILSARGGVWVVTDLTFLFPVSDSGAGMLREHVASVTGFNPAEGFFLSVAQAKRFFEAQGFRVQEHPRASIAGRLSTASGVDQGVVAWLLESQVSFALEV